MFAYMEGILFLQYGALFLVALYALVRGADVFVNGAQSIGVSLGIRPFIVGVCIVGLGTSLPELAASLASIQQGQTDVVLANVVGSNITNILLIAGLLAVLAGGIYIRTDMLHGELPLFVLSTAFLLLVMYDGEVTTVEGVLLLCGLLAYLWYLFASKGTYLKESVHTEPTYKRYDALTMILAGALIIMLGANYTIVSLVALATAIDIPVSVLSIVLIAVGTSLPELVVSLQAIKMGETEMAVGNLFGSNSFNILMVVGVSALFSPLASAPVVVELGLYVLLAASVVFFVIGLARQLMPWSGVLMLLLYGFFLLQLVQFM